MYWLLRNKSQLSAGNKLLMYKAILKSGRSVVHGLQFEYRDITKIPNTFELSLMLPATSLTLRHNLNAPYVRDEIRRLAQRYADRMKKHPNIVTNLMRSFKTPRRLKRRLPEDLISVAHATGHMLFKTFSLISPTATCKCRVSDMLVIIFRMMI